MEKLTNEREILEELRKLTKKKEEWQTSIKDVAVMLEDIYSSNVKAKALWLLGEMGLKYPLQVQGYIDKIASYLENEDPKLRERSVNALGRIGRADYKLVIPYLEKLMKMREDKADNVRLSFVWACENIATNAPHLYYEELKLFYDLIQDTSDRVRIEAPEMFRVIGKRKPEYVEPYLEKLQWFVDNDTRPVVRIHCAGAIRITKKALEESENATDE